MTHPSTYTADVIQQLVTDRPSAPWKITTRGGAVAPRAYIHEIWPDKIVCGTRDTVHATYQLDTLASVEPAANPSGLAGPVPVAVARREPPSYADADAALTAELGAERAATYDDGRWGPATPTSAGTAYLAGYRDGAADTLAELRELEGAELDAQAEHYRAEAIAAAWELDGADR